MTIKGILFDLDGTLLDTLPDIHDAVNVGLRSVGHAEASLSEIRSWVGDGLPTLCRRAVRQDPAVDIGGLATVISTYYAEHCLNNAMLFPGIADLLDELTQRRIPMAILSNKPHVHTAPMVEAVLSRWPWVAVEGCRKDEYRKPDPRTARAVVSAMQLEPGEVMMVGDSDADILTARNVGLLSVAVTWGYRDRPVLIDAGAAHLIDQPAQLLMLFQASEDGAT